MEKGKKNIVIALISLIAVGFMFTVNIHQVQAFIFGDDLGGAETVDFLNRHADRLIYGDVWTVLLHTLGWGFVRFFFSLTSWVEALIPETFTLLDFLESAGLNALSSSIINELVLVLLILMITVLGFKIVVAKEPPKFKNVFVNVLVAIALIAGLPSVMDMMEDIALSFYDGTQQGNQSGVSSLSWGLVKDNTVDVLYLAQHGFDNVGEDDAKNNLREESLRKANLTSIITPDVIDEADNAGDLEHLKYIVEQDQNGEDIAVKIENGGFLNLFADTFDTGYMRYSAKFTPILVGLIGLGVAYLFAIFVLVTTIIELGVKSVVGYLVFATDLETGQRTKMVVKDIGNAFMLIAMTGLSLRIYTIFLTFLGSIEINILLYVIGIVSATYVLIKGSSTIMRYFGVDVGVQSGFGQLAGALGLGLGFAKGLGNMGKQAISSASNLADNKDKLAQDREEIQSINGSDDVLEAGAGSFSRLGGLKKSVNSAGLALGYASSRGIGGMAEDAIKGTGEVISNSTKSAKDGFSNNIKSVSDSAKSGFEAGKETAESNRNKWRSQNNLSASETKEDTGYDDSIYTEDSEISGGNATTPINRQADQSINSAQEKTGSGSNIESMNQDINETMNTATGETAPINRETNARINSLTGNVTPINREIIESINDSTSDTGSVNRKVSENLSSAPNNTRSVSREMNESINGSINDTSSSTREVNERSNASANNAGSINRNVNESINTSTKNYGSVNREINDNVSVSVGNTGSGTREVNEVVNVISSGNKGSVNREINETVNNISAGNIGSVNREVNEKLNTTSGKVGSINREVNETLRPSSSNKNSVNREIQETVNSTSTGNTGSVNREVNETVNATTGHAKSINREINENVNTSSHSTGLVNREVNESINTNTQHNIRNINRATENHNEINQNNDLTSTTKKKNSDVSILKQLFDSVSSTDNLPKYKSRN